MVPFGMAAVNVALPAIQNEFSVNAIQLNWIATSFLLAVAVLVVPAGRIADIYGRKKVFIGGITIYTIATLFSGLSRSAEMLIFFRIFQGVGSAMQNATIVAILASVFPPQRRGRAIGIMAASVYIGLSIGPFLGGILVQQIGWRSIFLIIVPLGIAVVAITLKCLKSEWADAKGEPFDIMGSLLYMGSISVSVYGASLLPNAVAMALIGTGILCFAAFIWQELRTRYPVFEVRLFTQNRLFTFSSAAAMINYSATYALTFLLSLYLQYIKGMTPQMAGTILVTMPVIMAVFSPLAGKLSDRIQPGKISSLGMTINTLGLLLFAFLGPETGLGYIICTLVLSGVGFALFSSPNMNALMGAVEKRYLGIAAGALSTMRLMGQMVSMAVAMVIFAVVIGRVEISPANYGLFLKSARISFSFSAALCFAGIFFSLFRGASGTRHSKSNAITESK